MDDRKAARVGIVIPVCFALLFTWNVFDARGPAPRYFAAAMVAVFTFISASRFLRYRERFRTAR